MGVKIEEAFYMVFELFDCVSDPSIIDIEAFRFLLACSRVYVLCMSCSC